MFEKTSFRLAAFAASLALAGGAAAAVGAATDPAPPFEPCLAAQTEDMGMEGEDMVAAVPGSDGLRAKLGGLELAPGARSLPRAERVTWRFRVLDCDGDAVRGFEPEQGKLLHLIVVRTDLTGYQHLHPVREPGGTWRVEVDTARGGAYRAIADFVVDGRKYVVGTTLTAPEGAAAAPLPAPRLTARVDGYDVELQRPAVLAAGEEEQLTFRITRHGRPARDLEPYLGAYGHLVALHVPELAYSHVHPAGEDRATGAITFDTEFGEPGAYRLFLQFQTRGRVHTVAFTQHVTEEDDAA